MQLGDTISCICGHFKIILESIKDINYEEIVPCNPEKRKGFLTVLIEENQVGYQHVFMDKLEILTVEDNNTIKSCPYLLIEKTFF
jgi:hypothetical protein